jgi:uncharacterized protein (DUF4415 family)
MAKIKMTAEEIHEKYGKDEAEAIVAAKSAPEEKKLPFKPGPVAARGFAAFKEHINRNGRPKAIDKKVIVAIRIPNSTLEKLRATGRGWQTRVSEYLETGIANGNL